MRLTLPQLRTVLLAQSIEQVDGGRTLVSQADWDEATRTAVATARQRGVPRVGAGDVVLERADTVALRASGRDTTVSALHEPGAAWRWLARGLPLLALAMGLAIDRIANAHRVDLLSPPLLTVLAWNLCVYLLMAWRAWRPPASRLALLQGLRHLHRRLGTGRGRGLAARIVADFHARWWAHTADLQVQRAARVLHLCAAAWGAGIALSLLLRGLVVRYQFGWESTFLDAAQVHAIVSVLFWPLAVLFGTAPFTLQEIAATQNFAGEGAGGSRWVWMYVGLLALVVVVPRLALAAWTRWRECRWQARIDPSDAAFDALRAALPGDLLIGLHGPFAEVLQNAAVQTPQGDRLQFGDVRQPVDAVLAWTTDALPPAWQGAPLLALPWEDFGASWVLEPALFDRLAAALPAQQHALGRLRAAWVERNELRFRQSLQALARHLHACAHPGAGDAPAQHNHYARQVQALDATLRALHGQPPASTAGDEPPSLQGHAALPAPRRASTTALAVGTSAGAAAGAAAGAKAGALIDVGTGGLTLGAGTALGALLGGTTAWVLKSLQKKDDKDEVLRHAAEAACTHYLVIAHVARVPPADAARLAERWRAEVTGTVAAHGDALACALQHEGRGDDAVQALLHTMLTGILRRSFANGGTDAAAEAPPGKAA
ncbi:DUF2868 domain-containing protein [Acidovorax sp. sic0104]|uniref:DUF3482 domain-containing protein n=1 Tax=Acidovorax sp. sic0104 TaxID=2854784 RepID=UPI001C438527|nr:DUF2868 domain-containing protein [Acidovorax sp. sic0104]MBV7541576.1 DUF2868 domain-containing protein [Acidovorax sp. sic0104]